MTLQPKNQTFQYVKQCTYYRHLLCSQDLGIIVILPLTNLIHISSNLGDHQHTVVAFEIKDV